MHSPSQPASDAELNWQPFSTCPPWETLLFGAIPSAQGPGGMLERYCVGSTIEFDGQIITADWCYGFKPTHWKRIAPIESGGLSNFNQKYDTVKAIP